MLSAESLRLNKIAKIMNVRLCSRITGASILQRKHNQGAVEELDLGFNAAGIVQMFSTSYNGDG